MAAAAWFRSRSQLSLFMLTSLFFSENLCLCLFRDSFFVYLDSCWSLSYVWCVQYPYSFLRTAVSPLKLTACLPFWKKRLLILVNKNSFTVTIVFSTSFVITKWPTNGVRQKTYLLLTLSISLRNTIPRKRGPKSMLLYVHISAHYLIQLFLTNTALQSYHLCSWNRRQ